MVKLKEQKGVPTEFTFLLNYYEQVCVEITLSSDDLAETDDGTKNYTNRCPACSFPGKPLLKFTANK